MTATAGADTIAAIATPPGEGAIAIVRASGPGCHAIATSMLRAVGAGESARLTPRNATFVEVVDAAGAPIDQAVAVLYTAPNSYTGEDLLEVLCHGGRVVTRRVLEALLAAGARPAEAGEFTRRAFINGKLDLARAEAVVGLIAARSEAAARAALNQLRGGLSERVNASAEKIKDVLALVEAYVDFPEEDLPAEQQAGRVAAMEVVAADLSEMLERTDTRLIDREGARIAIAGLPNAGKSSLFNALAGRERAIVSPVAGTTRDVLESGAMLDGALVTLVDTAGLRSDTTVDAAAVEPAAYEAIERVGVARAREILATADLIVYVIDAAAGFTRVDRDELERFAERERSAAVLVVFNKTDLREAQQDVALPPWCGEPLRVSAKTGAHLAELRQAIAARVTAAVVDDPLVTSERHRSALVDAFAAVKRCLTMWRAKPAPLAADELAAADLRFALAALGSITGARDHGAITEELLDRIFSRFCIGK